MLDKAPNGKVSDLLAALDKALSAGEVEHAVDLFHLRVLGSKREPVVGTQIGHDASRRRIDKEVGGVALRIDDAKAAQLFLVGQG